LINNMQMQLYIIPNTDIKITAKWKKVITYTYHKAQCKSFKLYEDLKCVGERPPVSRVSY